MLNFNNSSAATKFRPRDFRVNFQIFLVIYTIIYQNNLHAILY